VIVDDESPGRLVVRSSAKLNLFLEVGPRRPDGYHEIETLFHEISIFDRLEITARESAAPGLELICDTPGLAPPGANLVERAAAMFLAETGLRRGAKIELHKNVPPGAGLGGGSANAAATLLALQRLLGTRLTWDRLHALASALGSDCAFFLRGGSALGTGRGERLRQMQLPRFAFLVVVPPARCSTAEIYGALARSRASASLKATIPTRTIADAADLSGIDRAGLDRAAFNRLESVAFDSYPQLSNLAAALSQACKSPVHMTGSGSGLFVICDDLESAEAKNTACQRSAAVRAALESGGTPADPTSWRTFVAESLPERSR
jgi:4-diphosphocytidyl-2-C-methyl-D-erythritol kinase